jgi:hypothetical protein
MNTKTKAGSQGICASGWRIPTDADWKKLEGYFYMSQAQQNKNNAYRGKEQAALLHEGSFNAELLGFYFGASTSTSTSTSTSRTHKISLFSYFLHFLKFYNWNAAMNTKTKAGSQGICDSCSPNTLVLYLAKPTDISLW